MGFLTPIEISMTALDAQKRKLEIIAENIANADTVMTPSGTFYKRQVPVFEQVLDNEGVKGVKITEIKTEESEGVLRYEPSNPYADSRGFVKYPDINIVTEMTEMISAQRAYEANLAVAGSVRSMVAKALEI